MKWLLILALPLFLGAAVVEIEEVDDLRDLHEFIEPGALVVVELDTSLIEPTQMLGSLEWLEDEAGQRIAFGVSALEAYRSLLPLWNRVLAKTEVQPTSPLVPGWIRNLQWRGTVVMGITNREIDVAATTVEQLRSVSIHIWPWDESANGLEGYCNAPTKYVGGVLFCGHRNPQGRALIDLLAHSGYRPSKVIYISNNWRKIHDLELAMQSIDMNYMGVRYVRSERKYDRDIARMQLRFFDRVLSNEAAQELVRRRSFWWFF